MKTELIRALESVRQLNPDMTVLQLLVLLYIADNPGCKALKVREAIGIPSSTTSRILATLSDVGRNDLNGMGLISMEIDSKDRRHRELFLTQLGQRLVKRIAE